MPCPGPRVSRRHMIQAGAASYVGLTLPKLLKADETRARAASADHLIIVFLNGGPSHLDMWDPKPDAPEEIRGEFRPIETSTPGIRICEHLPLLARRSHLWSLVRSLTHPSNDHSAGHMIMLSGRSTLPPGFDPARPRTTDWPSIAAVAGAMAPAPNNLPPAVVLP